MLTLTHPVQLFPREDHAGNTPWPPHIHLHQWKAHTKPTICDDIDLMGDSSGELEDLTNRLVVRATAYGVEVSTKRARS